MNFSQRNAASYAIRNRLIWLAENLTRTDNEGLQRHWSEEFVKLVGAHRELATKPRTQNLIRYIEKEYYA